MKLSSKYVLKVHLTDDFVSLYDSDCGKSGAGSDRLKPAVWPRQSNWIVRASQVDRQAFGSCDSL